MWNGEIGDKIELTPKDIIEENYELARIRINCGGWRIALWILFSNYRSIKMYDFYYMKLWKFYVVVLTFIACRDLKLRFHGSKGIRFKRMVLDELIADDNISVKDAIKAAKVKYVNTLGLEKSS